MQRRWPKRNGWNEGKEKTVPLEERILDSERGGGRVGEWRGPRKLRPFRLTMPLRLISRTVSLWLDVSTLIYWVFW